MLIHIYLMSATFKNKANKAIWKQKHKEIRLENLTPYFPQQVLLRHRWFMNSRHFIPDKFSHFEAAKFTSASWKFQLLFFFSIVLAEERRKQQKMYLACSLMNTMQRRIENFLCFSLFLFSVWKPAKEQLSLLITSTVTLTSGRAAESLR